LGLGNYVHFVYAFSKDFALSGLRVGVAYSENPDIRLPLQKLNDLCQISSTTQQLVETMLTAPCSEQPFWTDHFLAENQSRILERCRLLQATLDDCGVPYLSATAGLFVWMDMRQFLPASGTKEERERTLYLELLKGHGLLVTPGLSMRHEHPGFFRCVFTPVNDEEFDLGLQRIRNFVASKKE
jgi:aspartate/methionine/tyrosine aminotransferase